MISLLFSLKNFLVEGLQEISDTFEQREKAYRDLQTDYQNFSGLFDTAKPEQRQAINSRVRNIITNISQSGGGLGNNIDVDDVVEMLDEDNKSEKGNLAYSYYRDRRAGQSYIRLSKGNGEEVVDIPITDVQAQNISPEIVLTDPFYSLYGKRFLNTQTTDPTGEGKITAIAPPNGGNYGKYRVATHLRQVDGEYEIQMYVYDKQKSEWVSEGRVLDLKDRDMLSQDQVLKTLAGLNEAVIEEFLNPKK